MVMSRLGGAARTTALAGLLFAMTPAVSQPIAWPSGSLRPPGTDVEAPRLSSVALSGNVAVTGYAGTPGRGFQVYFRTRIPDGWSPPVLLVEGVDSSDTDVLLSADSQRLAIASPAYAGSGRVSIYVRDIESASWILEQIINAPANAEAFGETLSLRGNLLVVTSHQGNGAVYSYRRDSKSGVWSEAGFEFENIMLGSVSAVTDGERIAYCRPLMLSACKSIIYSEERGWHDEAMPEPWETPPGQVVGIRDGLMFVRSGSTVTVYERVGFNWLPGQQIPMSRGFSLSSDGMSMLVSQLYDSQIYTRSAGGTWEIAAEFELATPSLAIDGTMALVGSQSFGSITGSFIASGDAAGRFDLTDTYFGSSILQVGSELWVAAPGLDIHDQSAGSVWIYPDLGTGVQPQAPELVPTPPAFGSDFGRLLASDAGRVAVYSHRQVDAWTWTGSILIFDATNHQALQRVDLPIPDGDVTSLSAAMAGDLLAVSRVENCAGACGSKLLIYRDAGPGFELAQTLFLPAGVSSSQFAQSTHLRGDWILSGKLAFRSLAGGEYQYEGTLLRPFGVSWGGPQTGEDGDRLVLSAYGDDRILVVFGFDNASGWTYSGSVFSGAYPIGNSVRSFAIRGNRIAMTLDGRDNEIYLAVRNAVGSDWTVIGSATLPEAAWDSLDQGAYMLAWADDKIAIGTPVTGEEFAGEGIGHVQLMTLDESVFYSGFE